MSVIDNSRGAFDDQVVVTLAPVAGWKFQYNVNSELVNTILTGSGTVTHANAMAHCNTTAATSSSAAIETVRIFRYLAGIGGVVRFTAVFTPPKEGSTQKIGIRNGDNMLAYGFNDLEFGIFHENAGTETFIPQSRFKGDPFSVDFTNGNVFQIRYQWLGFGNMLFNVEELGEQGFSLVHTIEYPNTSPVPSLSNPSMRPFMEAVNTTNNTAITIASPSMMAFREGAGDADGHSNNPLSLLRSFRNSATITTEEPILAVRGMSTYLGQDSMIAPHVLKLGFSTEGNKPVTFYLYRGVTLTAPTWVNWDGDNSSLESDILASGFSGGHFVFAYELGKSDSLLDDVQSIAIELEPDEVLLITAESALTSDVTVSLMMLESF
jgi:hypothetical protein